MASRVVARITIKVHPRAKRTSIAGRLGDAWKLDLAAPPVDGKANDAVARLLAAHLQLPTSRVGLVSGAVCCSCRARSAFVLAADRG